MLQTTDNNGPSNQAGQNEKNQDALNGAGEGASSSKTGESIKNLSTATKSAKSKKPKLTEPKESDDAFSRTNFLTSKAQKAFLYL